MRRIFEVATTGASGTHFKVACRAATTLYGDMTPIATVPTAPRSRRDLTFAELEREFVADGLSPVHIQSLWRRCSAT
jgi:hypothetical protein